VRDKNLKKIQGRSLVARAIEAALHASSIERVFVSTDSAAIAREARAAGAEVIDRPAAISGDEASTETALLHALEIFDAAPEVLVLIQPTSPFVSAAEIDGVVAKVAGGADTAHTVTATHRFLWRMEENVAVGVNHDPRSRLRRQDRPTEFLETGAAYAMRAPEFRAVRHRFFGRIEVVEMNASRALEIDTLEDLRMARALATLLDPEVRAAAVPYPLAAIVFDFDGVLSDNRVAQKANGAETVFCSRGDGLGLAMLREAGVPMIVISKERNPVVALRCRKLGLDLRQGIDHKLPELEGYAAEIGADLANIIYVGNDINDLDCLDAAGLGVVPADAHPQARARADIVLSAKGGRGAVRQLADIIMVRLRL